MLRAKGIVLSSKDWKMVDEHTGEIREGVSIEYLLQTSMQPIVNADGSKGTKRGKGSVNILRKENIKNVPAVYDMEFEMAIVKDKPQMKLVDLMWIEDLPFKTSKPESLKKD